MLSVTANRRKLKTVSVSYQTVSEITDSVSDTLRCVMNDCEYHSPGLDESRGERGIRAQVGKTAHFFFWHDLMAAAAV
jgi:hypothetical protein